MADIALSTLSSLLCILIVLSGCFSASETAMLSLNRYRLKHLVKQGHRGAIRAEQLLRRPDRLIGLILLANNFVNILASSIATLIALRLLGEAGIAVATGLLTLVILVALAVASLGTTIYFAEQLGRLYDLDAAGWITPVHLTLAKVTTFAYVAPIFTGFRLLKDPTWRPRHKRMAFLVLGLTLLTAATGTWMILASEPLPVGE